MSKLKTLATILMFALVLFVFPLTVNATASAESSTPPAADLPGGGLPGEGLPDETDGETETPVEASKETITKDFLTGAGVGLAFGFIVGGVVVWFSKRS